MGQKKSKHSSTVALDPVVIRRITSITSFLPDEIQYFHRGFLKYTPSGHLTLDHFESFYKTLFHYGIPETFARYAFDAFDTNRDEIIDFEEFIIGLFYTTKASPIEKIRWAFDLCDRDNDRRLNVIELENIIQALYDLSDDDMARAETYEEAIERIKQVFLSNPDDDTNTELLESVTKNDFVNIVQQDAMIMKLLDCGSITNKRTQKYENSTTNLFKKHLKVKSSIQKSLSDSNINNSKQK